MIRKATIEDKNDIKRLVVEFHEESLGEFKLSFNWEDIDNLIKNFILNHITFVSQTNEKVDGIIAGMLTHSNFDKSEPIAQEFIWYLSKEARKGSTGIRLLKAFETKAKRLGAKFILMMYMGNLFKDTLEKLYRKNKYKHLESQYIKEI